MGFNARSSRGNLGMSAFVVSNIKPSLKIDANQRFIFGLDEFPEPLGAFKLDNIFTPITGNPSITNFETRNKDLSGFRWVHTTNIGNTFGSLKLQSFINAQSTGTDILLFNQDGTVVFNQPITFPGIVISGDFDMNSYNIINLADPVNDQDAATKFFVEYLVGNSFVTLSGAVTGSGAVGSTIITTLTNIDTSQITDFISAVTSFTLNDFAIPVSDIDLNNNKIINLANPTLATDGASKGYVDSVVSGSSITLTGAVTGSGSGTVNTTLTPITTSQISDFTSSVVAFRLNEFAAPTSNLDLNNQKIINLGTPINAQDAATKAYVDSTSGGGGSVTLTGAVTGSGTGTIATTLNPTVNINSASYAFTLNNANSSSITEFQISHGIPGTPYLRLGVNAVLSETYINSIFDNFIIKIGGTDRFIFSTTGNLGIGGSVPTQAKLVVNGGVQNVTGEETAIRAISSLNNIKIELQNTAASGRLYEIRSSSTGQFDITDRTNSTTRFTIGSSGNIGIGQSIPNAELQLSNRTSNRKIILFEEGNNNHQFSGFGLNNNEVRYQIASSASDHIFYSAINAAGSLELARIKGIGTAQFKKIVGYASTKPNITNLGALGVGGTFSINGSSSELSGTITIFSGTSDNLAGPLVSISLLNVMPNTSWGVILFPGNSSATEVSDRIFALVSSNYQFVISTRIALANNTTYTWNYQIIGA